MKYIKEMVDHIEEEIEGARDYAEKYVECKAKGNMSKASKYAEMANDELRHAMIQHEWANQSIDELEKIYTPPEHMMEVWRKAHKEFVEKLAWIKQMLAL